MKHRSNCFLSALVPARFLRRILSLVAASLALLLSHAALADGDETLGTTTVASGTGFVNAGTGLVLGDNTINITVPAGASVVQTILYWQGFGTEDGTIVIEGTAVTGALIGGGVIDGTLPSAVYRADITGLVPIVEGLNSVSVSGLTFGTASNGAGLMVVIDDGSGAANLELRDGHDHAFIGSIPPFDVTVPQTFTFAAAPSDRVATLNMFFASVAGTASGGGFRPSAIDVTVDGVLSEFNNLLDSKDGEEWDSVELDFDIPAGATELTVQAFSEDRELIGGSPASFVWLAAGLAVPPPQKNPDIELLKQVSVDGGLNYLDADDPGSAPTDLGDGALYRLIVSNTGDVDLTNVVINDPTLGISNVVIEDLVVGEDRIIGSGDIPALDAPDVCDAPGTVENIASVSADPVGGGNPVNASDPANVICPEEQVGCWFTGGQNIQVNKVRGKPDHSGGGNIYPSCSALPGDGGQWTHTDHLQGLHFQAQSLTVVECSNVQEIPPGAPSPKVTVNRIRAVATGIIKGVQGNTLPEAPATAVVVMEDWGEPGRNDRYTIEATGGGETINLDRAALENGGNFQIHQSSCDN